MGRTPIHVPHSEKRFFLNQWNYILFQIQKGIIKTFSTRVKTLKRNSPVECHMQIKCLGGHRDHHVLEMLKIDFKKNNLIFFKIIIKESKPVTIFTSKYNDKL